MLFNKKTLFAPPSNEKKDENQSRRQAAEARAADLKKAAAACYADPLFKEYEEKLKAGVDAYLDLFAAVNLPSMEQEWKLFKQLQAELNVLRSLSNDVRSKINR